MVQRRSVYNLNCVFIHCIYFKNNFVYKKNILLYQSVLNDLFNLLRENNSYASLKIDFR